MIKNLFKLKSFHINPTRMSTFKLANFCSKDNKNSGLSSEPNTFDLNDAKMDKNYKQTFTSKKQRSNRAELLKREIVDNPEFFKAFPHMSDIVHSTTDTAENDTKKYIRENYKSKDEKRDTEVNERRTNYFESLL